MACRPLISHAYKAPSGALDLGGIAAYQWSFLVVAGFYLVFALPAFFLLRESPAQGEARALSGYAATGFRRVADTLRHLRNYRDTARFILASLFFTDGITTVIGFAGIYATTTMGFTNSELVLLFLVLNIAAFPGLLAAGYVADWIGPKRTRDCHADSVAGGGLRAAMANGKASFWAVAVGAAVGMGSTQAVGRSFMSQIHAAVAIGRVLRLLCVFSGKFASMFGPLIFGLVSSRTGSQRMAEFSLLPLFVLGLFYMLRIDEQRARHSALE